MACAHPWEESWHKVEERDGAVIGMRDHPNEVVVVARRLADEDPNIDVFATRTRMAPVISDPEMARALPPPGFTHTP